MKKNLLVPNHYSSCSCPPQYSGPNCSELVVEPVVQRPLDGNGGSQWVTWTLVVLGSVMILIAGVIVYLKRR